MAQTSFTEDDAARTGGVRTGGVPNAFRNAVFWRWSREMPRALPNAVLTMLYALGAAADAAGWIRFADDHQPVRMSDIAAAARCDVKDARRYIASLVAAGVVAVQGDQGPGKRPMYILLMSACPDWEAAVASLADSKRKRTPKTAPPWQQEKPGGPTPEVTTDAPDDIGGPTPEPGGATPGGRPPKSSDAAETEFGGPAPAGLRGADPREFGGPTPQQPMSPREVPQEIADVDDQPAGVAREPSRAKIDFHQLPMGGAAYRAAARMHLSRQGPAPTPAEIDAHAAELATLDQTEGETAEEASQAHLVLLPPTRPRAGRTPADAPYQPPILHSLQTAEGQQTAERDADGTRILRDGVGKWATG